MTYDPKNDNIEEVLAHVGDDPETAAEVLPLELQGKDRSTLVNALKSIAGFDQAQDEEDDDNTVTFRLGGKVMGWFDEFEDEKAEIQDILESMDTRKYGTKGMSYKLVTTDPEPLIRIAEAFAKAADKSQGDKARDYTATRFRNRVEQAATDARKLGADYTAPEPQAPGAQPDEPEDVEETESDQDKVKVAS